MGATRIGHGGVYMEQAGLRRKTGLLMQVKWSLEMIRDAEHKVMRVIVYRQFMSLKSHEIIVL